MNLLKSDSNHLYMLSTSFRPKALDLIIWSMYELTRLTIHLAFDRDQREDLFKTNPYKDIIIHHLGKILTIFSTLRPCTYKSCTEKI